MASRTRDAGDELRRPMGAALLLALGRRQLGLVRACLAPPLRRVAGGWPPAQRVVCGLRTRAARAVSLAGALLLFAGAVLAGRALYLRGQAELAALLVRKAHEETLRTDRETPPLAAGRHLPGGPAALAYWTGAQPGRQRPSLPGVVPGVARTRQLAQLAADSPGALACSG